MSDSAVRYRPEDIVVPEGLSDTDMDWFVMSWDLRTVFDSGTLLSQFIMVPGAVIARHAKEKPVSWRRRESSPPDGIEMFSSLDYPDEPLSDFAQRSTESQLRSGAQMTVKPYAFVIDPKKYPAWPKHYRTTDPDSLYVRVETLGDLVRHTPTMVMVELFNETFEHRKKQVKHRWKK